MDDFPWPDEWHDSSAVAFYFSPLGNDKNTDEYHSKYNFWSQLIELYCIQYNTFTFLYYDLLRFFTKADGLEPKKILKQVLNEMLLQFKLINIHYRPRKSEYERARKGKQD